MKARLEEALLRGEGARGEMMKRCRIPAGTSYPCPPVPFEGTQVALDINEFVGFVHTIHFHPCPFHPLFTTVHSFADHLWFCIRFQLSKVYLGLSSSPVKNMKPTKKFQDVLKCYVSV